MSADNIKGLVLALSSSLFIGASFIIKKKGLRRAAVSSGVRAGPPRSRPLALSLWPLVAGAVRFLAKRDVCFAWFGFSDDMMMMMAYAGVGGYSYLMEPLWWVGMITSKVSSCDFSRELGVMLR